MTEPNRVALLVDAENVVNFLDEAALEAVAAIAAENGRVAVRRAYADWTNGSLSRLRPALVRLGFEHVHVPHLVAGKNSADIEMAVDATTLSFEREELDTFVLVTGDSDFGPLFRRLAVEHRVIGVLPASPLRSAVERFVHRVVPVESLARAAPKQVSPQVAPSRPAAPLRPATLAPPTSCSVPLRPPERVVEHAALVAAAPNSDAAHAAASGSRGATKAEPACAELRRRLKLTGWSCFDGVLLRAVALAMPVSPGDAVAIAEVSGALPEVAPARVRAAASVLLKSGVARRGPAPTPDATASWFRIPTVSEGALLDRVDAALLGRIAQLIGASPELDVVAPFLSGPADVARFERLRDEALVVGAAATAE